MPIFYQLEFIFPISKTRKVVHNKCPYFISENLQNFNEKINNKIICKDKFETSNEQIKMRV